ncbi:uncharacterized protein LOC128965541 [Oppia nitens]|uniref:uncharacterized protein LOC128965541 n=1 Tax=Oppia nitens TaxID=1686743 RepID=UPI0023DCACE0|nr:uncharacterized protein LOC128965541 [Oppia nitens]
MITKNYIFLAFVTLFISFEVKCISFKQLIQSLEESVDCPSLCSDSQPITAISPIDKTPQMLVISGQCAYIVDPTQPQLNQRKNGFKHSLAFTDIQDMFVLTNNLDIELVSIYASGTLVQVISSNGTNSSQDFIASNVFEGLTTDLEKPIDAVFVWTDKRIAYFIQGSKYWAYELTENWKKGSKLLGDNYPRSIGDFGLSNDHKISTAFTDSAKIYFVSIDLIHVFRVSDIDPKTGRFYGRLSKVTIKLKDFLKCPMIYDSDYSVDNQSSNWMDFVTKICSNATDTFDSCEELLVTLLLLALILGVALLLILLMQYIDISSVHKFSTKTSHL